MTENLPASLPPALSKAQQAAVINIVRRAARTEIMPRFRKLGSGDIASKTRADDLVTKADTRAEAMITRALQMAHPDALIVGEEAASENPKLVDGIADAPLAFIIDPVDGTWNFAKGLPLFGVILAVTQYGRPAFGMIYDPVMDDWAIADTEAPPQMQTPFGIPRPLKVSMGKPVEELSGYVPLHLFAHHLRPKIAATFPSFARVGSLRCSAHEYRMVAQGHVDFLLSETLKPWDHAAGALIAARAGAHVELLEGGDYSAGRREGHLLVAPDKTTWNRIKKVLGFIVA